MAAYAALVSLMNDIEQIMNHPRLSNCFDNEQIQSVLQKAGFLLDFIEGYKHGGLVTEEAYNVLERQITSVADEAADVIETHIVDQILDVESTNHVRNKVLGWARRIACAEKALISCDLTLPILHMGDAAEKAMEVKEKEGIREEEQPPTHPTTPHVGGSGSGETAMVGMEDELNQLLDSLTDHHSNRHVISIVGMGGTGKTTLARNLYANPLVKEHFDIRAWATVSQQCDLQDILSQLISCIGKSDNIGELGERVYKTLYGRRYLIVLDDIWGVEAWDKVRRFFPDIDGSRSRVVLTTRLSDVASVCASTCVDVNLLDEETSWKLFCEKALFPHKDEDPLQLENVAKKIVKSCKGLALSIVVIGGLLLKSPRTLGHWENVLKGLETNDSKEKQRGLDVLSLSYNHLPPHLKPCFLYMGVFDEDSRICVSKITKLWVAEGFIRQKGSRVLEEIAEDYLKDLGGRNLIQGVERGHTKKIKSFSMHDLVRDLCINVAEQQEFFHVRKSREIKGGRRLVMEQHNREVGGELVRSILGKDCDIEYRKCKLLRVLDANQNDYLAQACGIVNLRHLAINLRSSSYREIPTSACQLIWNLQTLIITKRSLSLVVAPLEIWKMRQLRHIKCCKVYLPDPRPRRNRQYYMENLQTLKTALNLRLTEKVCEIIPNIKKLHLIYEVFTRGYDYSFIECLHNLDRFHKLESLSMYIEIYRMPLRVSELHSKLAFPPSLKKLCLTHCQLFWEDMSVIGSLPQLQVLRLNFRAVTGDHWRPISGQFLSLKFLEIESCILDRWYADNSHFPVLETLVLRQLDRLEEIPLEIGEIPTLELIRVERCSISAAISAVKIKKDQVENQDNDALQIELGVLRSDLESFKKRLEAEELGLYPFELDIFYYR